jgi:glutamate N-acetyltransferase/amino-acid N-acetyltransferase
MLGGTGDAGLANAIKPAKHRLRCWCCDASQILPFSTSDSGTAASGPSDRRFAAGNCESAGRQLEFAAAEAIMTTDTQPKAASASIVIGGKTVQMTGISKGAGMIKLNMATMLGYLAMDARIAQPVLIIW